MSDGAVRNEAVTGRMAGPPQVFEARPGGIAEVIGHSFRGHRPLLAALVVWTVSFLLLGGFIVGLGLLLTHVLGHSWLTSVDRGWSLWFVREREPDLNVATRFGSDLGSTVVILGVAAVSGLLLLIGRYWRQLTFLALALVLEFGLFLATVTIVHRLRPPVARLDVAPPTSSFPSGHTASSLTLYVGLAIVVSSLVARRRLRSIAWVLGILLPVFVGLSRVYRGMHFATDVTGAALLAVGALLFALLAVRSMAAAGAGSEQSGAEASLDSDREAAA